MIAMLDVSTKTWSKIGSLNQGRSGHAVVVRSNDFIIVGGQDTKSTERCEMQNDEMICVSVEPELNNFAYYPEAMLVDENFCMDSESGSDQESESGSESLSSRFNVFLFSILTVQAVFC